MDRATTVTFFKDILRLVLSFLQPPNFLAGGRICLWQTACAIPAL